MLSFWEKESFSLYDIIVIGSGITGLSTAIELKKNRPDLSVIVLEKGVLPTGASTKNAGFACVGSLTEILSDLENSTPQDVMALVKMRYEGLLLLRNRLGDGHIGYEELGSYELCLDSKDYAADIEKINALLFPVFNQDVFSISDKKFSFSSSVKTVIESSVEGQVDTGKMMKSLLAYAGKLGVEIKTGYNVQGLKSSEDLIEIQHHTLPLKAKKVCICTNAFSKQLDESFELKPGRGQVLVTKPLNKLPFQGIFHFLEGYYYFRTIGNRVVFGGGRQLDFEAETTTDLSLNESIQNDLEDKLRTLILPDIEFEIDHRWAGIMAFGENKRPIIKQIEPGIYAAVRMGGMGVAIGSKVGELLSKLVLQEVD